MVIKYVEFDNNQASNNGGAIAIDNASNVSIENSNFSGNISINGLGGGIANKARIQVKETTFSENKANKTSGGGGAVYNNGESYEDDSNEYINNSTKGNGGAIYNAETTSQSNNLTIRGCKFGVEDDTDEGNTTNNYGGAIRNRGKLEITTSEFYGNKAGNGGAIAVDYSSASLSVASTSASQTIFKDNTALNGQGGAILITTAFTVNIGEDGVTASTVYFNANNVADGKGHSLAITGTSIVNIYRAEFILTEYTEDCGDGGVIYQNQGTLNIYNADINNNTITYGYGGGLYVAGGTCKILSIVIHHNTAKYGGGIAVAGSGKLTIENAEIYSNTALYGGGIYIKDSGSSVSLSSNASGGQAKVGLSNEDSMNTAVEDAESGETALGGGIYNNGKLNIVGGIVQNNTSDGNGGGIYNARQGVLTLTSGSIINNICKVSGGGVYCAENGTVTFACSQSVRMLIDSNLCADGAYPLCEYEEDGTGYGNGIYITNTRVVISGYITIGLNSDEDILNDIYYATIDASDKPTKLVEYSNNDSVATLADNTRICISSMAAIMGTKMVKFPTMAQAKNNLAKFSFAGDDAGFRVSDNYLILGNYTAIIIRDGVEVYYQSLTEAYIDAGMVDANTPETIYVYKNIKLAEDLKRYEESSDLNSAQENLLAGLTHDTITSTFYIAKKVIIASGGEYTISRAGLEGNMFTVIGGGQLTLGEKTPTSGATLTIQGAGSDGVETGSIIKVINNGEDSAQFILYNGVKLTKNISEKGGAIYNEGYAVLKGGEISNNTATATDGGKGGGVYSEGYLELIESPTITKNTADNGGGIYINNEDSTSTALFINSSTATISSNKASNGGGGIYVFAGNAKINACKITKNSASVGNSVDGAGGGGIYVYGSESGSSLEITNDSNSTAIRDKIVISENTSETDGGGIAIDNATFTFKIGTIKDNTADGIGGGVVIKNTTGETATGLFTTNNSSYLNQITGNTASNGGGIGVIKGTAKLYYIKLGGNTANGNGGGIYTSDKVELNNGSNIGFSGDGGRNTAGADGGGIYITRTGEVSVGTATPYIGYNEAVGYGGGVANAGTIHLDDIQMNSNKASVGGGIANMDSNSNIIVDRNLSIYNNTATSSELGGGGVYNNGTMTFTLMRGSSYIGSSTISNANIAYNGGGIYNLGKIIFKRTGTTTTHHGLYVQYNTATIYGGGIYNAGSIENYLDYLGANGWWSLNLQGNKTLTTNGGGGGGICNNGGTIEGRLLEDDSTCTISRGSWKNSICFTGNQTEGYGGGLLLMGDSNVHAVDFYYANNTAIYGGAVAVISGTYVEGCKETWINYGSQYSGNVANSGNDFYLRVSITFNSMLRNTTDVYLANSKSYLIFNTVWDRDKESWYTSNCNVTVDTADDGRRIAKFGYYTEMKVMVEGQPEEEVITYYADSYYLNFHLQNSEEGYGLAVNDDGYIVISDPVCYMGASSPYTNSSSKYGKYYSSIAEAVNDVKPGYTGNILLLKSHTVDQQVVIVNKNIYLWANQNIILTASRRLNSKSMFFVFSTNTDRTWKSTKYTFEVNRDVASDEFFYVRNGVRTSVAKGAFGKSAGVTITFDGNRAALGTTTVGAKAIVARSGAYYTETQDFYGGTVTVNVPVNTAASIPDWGVSDYYYNKGLYVNNQAVTRQTSFTKTDGSTYTRSNGTNFGTTLNQQPAMYNITINDCEFNNFQPGYGGTISTFLYTDDVSTGYYDNNSAYLSINRTSFDNNFQKNFHSHEHDYTYYIACGGGSCINATGGRLLIYDSTFTNNTSYMSGGAIQARWQSTSAATLTAYSAIYIEKSTFDNNRAYSGGAIQLTAVQGIVKLSNNTFNENSASYGGAVRYHSSTTTVKDFLNRLCGYPINSYLSHAADNTYNSKNYLYIESGNTFSANYTTATSYVNHPDHWAGQHGGAIYANGNIRDYGATYKDNSAVQSGGAICIDSDSGGHVYFSGTSFTNNSAGSEGGALYIIGVVEKFSNVKAEGNSAGTNGGAVRARTFEKLFCIDGVSTVFRSNTANAGGAIYWSRYYNNASSRIKDCFAIMSGEFSENSADNCGGAIYTNTACDSNNPNTYEKTSGGQGYASIEAWQWRYVEYRAYIWSAVKIDGNRAGNKGGGIYAAYNLVLYNAYITDNVVDKTSSYGGGAGVYCDGMLDIIQGTIQSNKITAESKGSGMGGGGVHCRGILSIGTAYSEYSSSGVSVDGTSGIVTFTTTNMLKYYHSAWESTAGSTRKYIRDTSKTLSRVLDSSNDQNSVKISENSCVNPETGLANADGSGVYANSYIYLERYIGITDEIYTQNIIYLSSSSIWIRDTIPITYGRTPSEGAIFIQLCSSNDLIQTEISRFFLSNSGWTLAWKGGNKYSDYAIAFKKSSLTVAVYANGWVYENNTYTRLDQDSGAKTANGMYTQTVTIPYDTDAKNLYNQIVPSFSGYSFSQFVYFSSNTITSLTASTAYKFSYNTTNSDSSSPLSQTSVQTRVPKTADGGALEVYIIWAPTQYTITMYKMVGTTDYSSKSTNDSPSSSENYTYKIRTGETFETLMTDFETSASTISGAKAGWTKSYFKGYELSYYLDYYTKKVYTKTDKYPYPTSTILRAVYVRRTYTLTFTPGDYGTANYAEGANILKVKYGSRANMLSANNVTRSGYKLTGWKDNTGKEYNLTSTYTAGTSFTEDITLEPIWTAVPYDLRLYYNFPDGGTSFLIMSVYAGSPIKNSLSSFTATPEGYELAGFSFDAEGTQLIDNSTEMPSENTIIYAQWSPKTVVLKFYDTDGNPINDMSIECKYGEEIELPELPGNPQVKLWMNMGDGLYYSEGSSFLVNSMTTRYLTFRMYTA